MNIIEITSVILDPLKLSVEIIATMFLTEPIYMTWLDQSKLRGSHSKNVDF
jgi:hypothetical protein